VVAVDKATPPDVAGEDAAEFFSRKRLLMLSALKRLGAGPECAEAVAFARTGVVVAETGLEPLWE
jgi:hypothetical protein